MKRVAIFTTACLVFLVCFTIHLTDGAGIPLAREDGTAKTRASKSTVTVVFRGLMVLHPDPAGKYFEAGISQQSIFLSISGSAAIESCRLKLSLLHRNGSVGVRDNAHCATKSVMSSVSCRVD